MVESWNNVYIKFWPTEHVEGYHFRSFSLSVEKESACVDNKIYNKSVAGCLSKLWLNKKKKSDSHTSSVDLPNLCFTTPSLWPTCLLILLFYAVALNIIKSYLENLFCSDFAIVFF